MHEPKFQPPRGKNELHKLKRENHKPHCFYDGEHENTLYKHVWCSHPSYHLGHNRNAPGIQAPHCQASANLVTVLSKDRSLSSAMLSLFCSVVKSTVLSSSDPGLIFYTLLLNINVTLSKLLKHFAPQFYQLLRSFN